MVIKELTKETVKGCIKTYIIDAGATYGACYIAGFSACVGYIGIKDGINFAKTVVKGAKKVVSKLKDNVKKQNPEVPNVETEETEESQE